MPPAGDATRSFARALQRLELDVEKILSAHSPRVATPGAREAGAVYFIDRALGTFMAPALDGVRGLAAMLDARAAGEGGDGGFSALDASAQDRILTAVEADEPGLFGLIQALTVMGTFSNPSYGGNRDEVGWRLLGFAPAERFDPPFGYYDAEYARTGGDR